MLTQPHREESLCRAYVQAVAAQAGLNFSWLAYDYGIDMTLRTVERVGEHYMDVGMPLDLQLKATTRAKVRPSHVVYDLEAKTYKHLRLSQNEGARILVLLVLPANESEWLSQSVDELILRRCAYWMSLRGMPKTKAKKSIRITIPTENVFSVQAVQSLMTRLQRGEGL
jgi:hypothetical protein